MIFQMILGTRITRVDTMLPMLVIFILVLTCYFASFSGLEAQTQSRLRIARISDAADGCKISKFVEKYYEDWINELKPSFSARYKALLRIDEIGVPSTGPAHDEFLQKIAKDKEFNFYPECESTIYVTLKLESGSADNGEKTKRLGLLYGKRRLIFIAPLENGICWRESGASGFESKGKSRKYRFTLRCVGVSKLQPITSSTDY